MAVSTLIITRDSAPWLAHTIANVRPWSAEVVVIVDAESQDDTLAVARRQADRVECWRVGGLQETVLNAAVELCQHEWIMHLDDDELLPDGFGAALNYLLDKPADEFAFNRLLLVGDGTQMALAENVYPDRQLRLRTRAAYRQAPWPARTHSLPDGDTGLRRWLVSTADTTIWHLNLLLRPAAERQRRMARLWELDPDGMTRTADWHAQFTSPWQYGAPPGPPPAQLAAVLRAVNMKAGSDGP
jgi:glycosyltransferase involved in cell wall biosynthesis